MFGVKIDGVTYSSVRQACEEYHVKYGTVCARIRRGWPADLAVTTDPKCRKITSDVVVHGTTYPNLREACDVLGVSYSTVLRRLDRGWTIERAFSDSRPYRPNHEVHVDGISYPSIRQAAIANGIPYQTMRKRLLFEAKNKITFRGKEYPSKNALAQEFGVNPDMLYWRLAMGWSMEDALNTPADTKSNPVVVEGISYSSICSASKAYNVNYNTVLSRLRKGYSIEEALKTPLKKVRKKNG